YDPFTFDITSVIRPGHTQKLLVSVWDPTTDGIAPVGKQNNRPHGIWYTPSSGIWQTVWLEIVPESYITNYKIYPDIDRNQAIIQVAVSNPGSRDHLEIDLLADGKKIGTFNGDIGEAIQMKIDRPHLWSPDDPYLYNLFIRLMRKNSRVDEVKGYFGMRKISLGKDNRGITRILLNNRFVFQSGPLDQGFWPDGLYTPPSDKAMKYDLKILKKMGFNMLRKHVKVESRRFYYHTDQMGLLVWQDMPSMFTGVFGPDRSAEQIREARDNFEIELTELVNDHYNHPSIVMWVPFNEGWGQYDTKRIVSLVRSLDSTRLINNASGWTDRGAGDVHDIHNYPDPRAPEPEENRAIVLGEFGGLGLSVPGHVWQQENWGYERFSSVEDLLTKYEKLWQKVYRLRDEAGLSAAVYTQTTDVETETNGLMTYDRDSVKMGFSKPSILRVSSGIQ
ncbi:MAG: beta-galactosidase, partial [Bacteroidales bacterium]|nr:beta-galactosidase [Bacteroidales bacterium]